MGDIIECKKHLQMEGKLLSILEIITEDPENISTRVIVEGKFPPRSDMPAKKVQWTCRGIIFPDSINNRVQTYLYEHGTMLYDLDLKRWYH